jgi:hypothetical protein
MIAAPTRQNWLTRRLLLRIAAVIFTAILLAGAGTTLSQSRLPRRAAGLYGGLVEKIRRYPEATAAICLTGVAATWVVIGLLAATERQPTPDP